MQFKFDKFKLQALNKITIFNIHFIFTLNKQ
jgi:hypothetical protein